MDYVSYSGNEPMITYQPFSDFTAQSKSLSALMSMCAQIEQYAANLLIENGAKIMPKDASGKAPLDYAESSEMIKLLKANGARE